MRRVGQGGACARARPSISAPGDLGRGAERDDAPAASSAPGALAALLQPALDQRVQPRARAARPAPRPRAARPPGRRRPPPRRRPRRRRPRARRPAVSPASTAIRRLGPAPRAAAARARDVLQRPDVRLPVDQRRPARCRRAGGAARRAGSTRPSPSTGTRSRAAPSRAARAAGRQGGRVLHRARHHVAARARGCPRSSPVTARLRASVAPEVKITHSGVGAHQRGHLARGPARAPRPARRPRSWRLDGLPNAPRPGTAASPRARAGRAARRPRGRGRRPAAHRPSASRWASSEGRPASRIAFWARGDVVGRAAELDRVAPRGRRAPRRRGRRGRAAGPPSRGSPASAPRSASAARRPARRRLSIAPSVVSRQAKGTWVWPISVSGTRRSSSAVARLLDLVRTYSHTGSRGLRVVERHRRRPGRAGASRSQLGPSRPRPMRLARPHQRRARARSANTSSETSPATPRSWLPPMQRSAPPIADGEAVDGVGAVAHEVAEAPPRRGARLAGGAQRRRRGPGDCRGCRSGWRPVAWRALSGGGRVRGYDSAGAATAAEGPGRWLPRGSSRPGRRARGGGGRRARAASSRCCAGSCGARASRTSRRPAWPTGSTRPSSPATATTARGVWTMAVIGAPARRRDRDVGVALLGGALAAGRGARGPGAALAGGRRSSARASRWRRSSVALPLSGARYAWGRDYGIVTQTRPRLAARPRQGARRAGGHRGRASGPARRSRSRRLPAAVVGGARRGRRRRSST